MKTRLALLLGMVTLLPMMGGCPGLSGSGTTHFTDAQYNNWNMTCQVGDRIVVMLRMNGSTGYTWQVATIDNTVLEYVQSHFTPDSGDLAGSPGTYAMEFNVTGVGSTQLVLQNVRPSDPPGTAPADTFTLNVAVTR